MEGFYVILPLTLTVPRKSLIGWLCFVVCQGTAYYIADPQEPPFKPPKIPAFKKHKKHMMYMYVTDYVVNSGFYAGFLSGQMRYNITKDVMDMVRISVVITILPQDGMKVAINM